MKKRDIFLIAILLALAAVLALLGGLFRGGDGVRIYLDGALYAEMSLAHDGETVIAQPNGGYNVVEVRDGRVRMREANCPTGTCVGCGWRDGEDARLLPDDGWIICLPNRVSVEIVADGIGFG